MSAMTGAVPIEWQLTARGGRDRAPTPAPRLAIADARRTLPPMSERLGHASSIADTVAVPATAGAADDVAHLVRASQHGDADAFGLLYDRFQPEILRYLTYQLRQRETAEDLAQQVFLNAWRAIPRFEERNVPFRAWLYRIAKNQLLDHVKRQRPTTNVDLVNPRDDTDIEAHAVAQDDRRRLIEALQGLSEDHREVLVLRFFMEKSAAETGAIMRRKEATIRGLQFRALRALRVVMSEMEGAR